jgi:hypothetical protein
MGELYHTIEERLTDAYHSLRNAQADDDLSLVDARQAEIEDLYRIAADHGIRPLESD